MALKLVDAALPKSRSGRKGSEIDNELVTALAEALTKSATVDTEDGNRPRALGPDTTYDTKGKASAAGRRYADQVAKTLKKIVRVNIYSTEKDKAPFYWRIYVPLTESAEAETPAPAAE